ncbi:MAG: hypothetical protein AAF573_14810 [Bacteroidota bacterium]
MLNTHIFRSNLNEPIRFTKISRDELVPCIGELEVINHERISWIYNIFKQEATPNFRACLRDVYHGMMGNIEKITITLEESYQN